MKLCAYYGCADPAIGNQVGFMFCEWHLAYLDKMIELDKQEDETFNAIAYCLLSLNGRNCENQELIL